MFTHATQSSMLGNRWCLPLPGPAAFGRPLAFAPNSILPRRTFKVMGLDHPCSQV